jgi:hypothetical protein
MIMLAWETFLYIILPYAKKKEKKPPHHQKKKLSTLTG